MRFVCAAAACLAALAFALAQDGEAPPAIAQWGITNWASRMPQQLPAGGVAPGSLIRIRGWRMGPAPLENIIIRIRRGDVSLQATALAADENEIEALMPVDAGPGSAMLQVVKNGHASLEWPVTIVRSSFGALSRNRQGWGPGEIANADGAANTLQHPAHPDETVTLQGTGLGVLQPGHLPEVLVAGRRAKRVRLMVQAAAHPGIDGIQFALPENTPEGCYVPVQVRSAPGIYSNTVTLAVTPRGEPCARPDDWTAGQRTRLGTVTLLHADLALGLTPAQTKQYPVDVGFASFVAIDPEASVNPLFLFPPDGTCATYSGTAGLHSITSPLAALESLPGTPLDAGSEVEVAAQQAHQLLPRGDAVNRNYWAVIGGHPPVPGAPDMPLFLHPGDYQVSARGGVDVDPFKATVRVGTPLVWRNREQLAVVDRNRGATVIWRASEGMPGSVVLIVAMNVDSRSGALGVCACVAKAGAGAFRIPAYALANIPKSAAHPRGFPLNLMLLADLPESSATPFAGQGLDRILAFAASLSARTVTYK